MFYDIVDLFSYIEIKSFILMKYEMFQFRYYDLNFRCVFIKFLRNMVYE